MKELKLAKIVKNGMVFNAFQKSEKKTVKTTILNTSINTEDVKINSLSETGKAYIENATARILVSALSTMFEKSGSDYFYRLYRDSVRMYHSGLVGVGITSIFDKWAVWENDVNERFDGRSEHETVYHEYSMVDYDGRKKRIMDVWKENVLTEKGKELDKFNISENPDVSDLYSDCYLAFAQLVNWGIVVDYADLWVYRQYAYKAITRKIRENRKYSTTENIDLYVSGSDSDSMINQKTAKTIYFDRTFSTLANDSVKKSIVLYLAKNLERRKNRDTDRIATVFGLYYFNNMTVEKIGEKFGLSHVMVLKNLETCKELLLSPHGLIFLRKSELITEQTYRKFLELDKAVNG